MNTSIKEVFSRLYSGAQSKLWTLLAVFLFTLHAPLHAQIKNINKTNDTISIPTHEIDSVWFDTNSGEMKVRKQDGTIQGHVFSGVNSFTFSANIYPSNGVYCNNLPTVPVEVTNATTGRVWMDRNLGASRVALSSTDALAYGDLYQWGRRADGHQCRNSPTTADLSSNAQTANGDFILTIFPATDWLAVPDNNLWQGFSGVNNPCPAGFRLPTANELQDERNSWTSNNIAGAFSNNLKWTLSGFRDFDGSLQEVNASAYYWSGNIDLLDAKYLKITSGTAAVLAGIRSLGMAVRCIKDNTYGNNAIYCNALPTQVVEVTTPTGKTWMDRNLGASQVAASANDVNAYGDLYQWGRRADGHQCRNSSTTSALSSSAQPVHGDFIVNNNSPYNWQSNINDNLWQGVEAINNPCPAGYRLPSAAEFDAERLYWSSQDASGAFASLLKLTLPGYRSGNAGELSDVGNLAYYWTNTVNLSAAQALFISNASAFTNINHRTYGLSVRCIKQVSYPQGSVACMQVPTLVVDVTNPQTGKTWMDRNLGASRAAQNSSDNLAYGDLYQWGRRADGHQCRYSANSGDISTTAQPVQGDFIVSGSTPFDWLSNANNDLWLGANASNNPCPSGYRLPTEAELDAERINWISNDAAGAFASTLKWPMAGNRSNSNGSIGNAGIFGYYWSSTAGGANSRYLNFNTTNAFIDNSYRAYGLSVRCIKDEPLPHTCGAGSVHNATLNYGSMTDQDGNVYKTIVIGTQEWMAENLKASHYRNGDAIPVVADSATWVNTLNGATCFYNNDSAVNNCPYGKLYNWYAASDVRNLCPAGWHVPTDAEWTTITTFLGGENAAGGIMKSTGTQYWQPQNAAADNSSGFSGLPGGSRSSFGVFEYLSNYGGWWSTSDTNTSNAWFRNLGSGYGHVDRFNYNKASGLSVRCIRDEGTTSSHTCGADSVHNLTLNYGSMTDQDGNVYKTIVVGTQEWMAENLKASHYRNGDAIALVNNNTTWQGLNTGATCFYNNDSAANNCPYGKLYNWYAVTSSNNVCPTGWHVPSDAEWTTLTTFLGGENVAGGKMKSTGTQYWQSPNAAADNSSGFSVLPGGVRDNNGTFGLIGSLGYWWSSTENGTLYAWNRSLSYSNGLAGRGDDVKTIGFSVRCLRD